MSCRHSARAISTFRTPPTYPVRALENDSQGSVDVTFRVDEFGQFVDVASAEPVGNTSHILVTNSQQTLCRWRLRPQCSPQSDRTITDQTTLCYKFAS